MAMDDEQQNEHGVLIAWILGIAVAIAIAVSLVTGVMSGLGGATAKAPEAAPAAGAAVIEVDLAPEAATGPGYPQGVRLYFETAKYALAADAPAQLAAIIEWARTEPSARLGISGFHDKQGDAAANAALARNRAAATRDALIGAGVATERIVMVKPQEATGGADDREARRVEVYPVR
ncbi:MAG: hypothetical protein BGO72_20200 [Burkholderiales bacterium 70-64]|nr:MAG: hypothetical protein BGO72_20200 [Burkholderiales bacterium 70-64]